MKRRLAVTLLAFSACTTSLPNIKHEKYSFPPENAYVSDVMKPYEKLGLVKSRVDYTTLDPNREETDLCSNYYNKGVRDLLKRAKQQHADAVINIRTIVFLEDGRVEQHVTPECSDDGSEGQVLLEGIAIRWKPTPGASGAPLPSPTPSPKASPRRIRQP